MKILNAVCSLLVALPAFAEEGLVLDYAAVLSPAVEKQESENNWHRVKALAIASAKKEQFALVLEKEFVVFSRDALDPTRELVGLVTPDREGTFSPRASRRDFGLRIATVDMGRAALATKLGQAAREQLKADVASRQAKLDVEQKAVKELSRRTETLSRKSAAYEQNMKELLVRTRALKTLTESGNSELQLAERAAIITLMQKLRPLVAALAERDGYSLVLDPYDADLVYADDDMDLTGEVIRLSDAGERCRRRRSSSPGRSRSSAPSIAPSSRRRGQRTETSPGRLNGLG